MRTKSRRFIAGLAGIWMVFAMLAGCTPNPNEGISIGLITKQEENTYWVTMRKTAERTARTEQVTLLTATGKSDVDVEGQEAAFKDMVAKGVDGIMIAPTDSTALNPLIKDARDAGIVVITVDTPVDPMDVADAYFGTDNHEAGLSVGKYAASRVKDMGLTPKVAMLNLAPGIASGSEREAGFLEGFGIEASDPQVVASVDTQGNKALAAEAMAGILAEHPDVSVIYTVNEEAAFGAIEALEAAKVDPSSVVLVSVDGSCAAMRDGVRTGKIAATAMQFPENMAREGIYAIIDVAHGGSAPSGFLNTGTQLVSGTPATGVDSRNVEYGIRNCWGS